MIDSNASTKNETTGKRRHIRKRRIPSAYLAAIEYALQKHIASVKIFSQEEYNFIYNDLLEIACRKFNDLYFISIVQKSLKDYSEKPLKQKKDNLISQEGSGDANALTEIFPVVPTDSVQQHEIPLKFYINNDRSMPLKQTSDNVPYPENLVLWADRSKDPDTAGMDRYTFFATQWGAAVDAGISLQKIKHKEPYTEGFMRYCERHKVNVHDYLPPSSKKIAASEDQYIERHYEQWEIDMLIRFSDRERAKNNYTPKPNENIL